MRMQQIVAGVVLMLTAVVLYGCQDSFFDVEQPTEVVEGPPGPPGEDGLHCWDTNGNGIADPAEDVNGDGAWDATDCQEPRGEEGPPGSSPSQICLTCSEGVSVSQVSKVPSIWSVTFVVESDGQCVARNCVADHHENDPDGAVRECRDRLGL